MLVSKNHLEDRLTSIKVLINWEGEYRAMLSRETMEGFGRLKKELLEVINTITHRHNALVNKHYALLRYLEVEDKPTYEHEYQKINKDK